MGHCSPASIWEMLQKSSARSSDHGRPGVPGPCCVQVANPTRTAEMQCTWDHCVSVGAHGDTVYVDYTSKHKRIPTFCSDADGLQRVGH